MKNGQHDAHTEAEVTRADTEAEVTRAGRSEIGRALAMLRWKTTRDDPDGDDAA